MLIYIIQTCNLLSAIITGGLGEKSLRQILDLASRVADGSLPIDADHLRRVVGDVTALANGLCELRAEGRGATPQVFMCSAFYLRLRISIKN